MSKQDLELKELALHFFKMGGVSAEAAYEIALSFLSIKRDKDGKDIVELTVKYNTDSIDGYICWTLMFEGNSHNIRMIGNFDIHTKDVDALEDYIEKNILSDYINESTSADWHIEHDLNIVVSDLDAYNIAV